MGGQLAHVLGVGPAALALRAAGALDADGQRPFAVGQGHFADDEQVGQVPGEHASLRLVLAEGLEHLPEFKDLDKYWIEIHRLENEGDRISRDAVASLFSNGIDPMIVIRWKDMFAVLENAIDATETAAHILEGIVIKNA